MCACLELNDTQILPGKAVAVWLEERRAAWLQWAGFARSESLDRWLAMGAQLVDVPARRFAQRSTRTGKLTWVPVPLGMVVRGLVDSNGGRPRLKVVTRLATAEEYAEFEHSRIPILERPRVSAEWIFSPAPVSERTQIVQPELFLA